MHPLVRHICMALTAAAAAIGFTPLATAAPGTGRPAVKFIEDMDERMYMAVLGDPSGGVFRVEGGVRGSAVVEAHVDDAAFGRDGVLYFTSGRSLMAVGRTPGEKPRNVTAWFGGSIVASSHVKCMEDGSIWVDGSANGRLFDGTFGAAPRAPEGTSRPAPRASDPFGNAWTLVPSSGGGGSSVCVLPAQAPDTWKPATGTGADTGRWHSLVADDFGGIWVAGGKALQRLDPRTPNDGWMGFTASDGLPDAEITALAVAASGGALVGFASGQLAECDSADGKARSVRVHQFRATNGPIRAVAVDGQGNTWIASGAGVARIEAPEGAWQKRWKLVCRLPFGNHDFDPAVVNSTLYLFGGYSHGYGYPAVRRYCDEVWTLDWDKKTWQVPARLPEPRWYAGVAALDGRIWIVDGQVLDGGRGKPVNTVLIYDPARRTVEVGPSTTVSRFGPVAVAIGGRIYVCGGEREAGSAPASMESIGIGEKQWRAEPPTPVATGPVAGCEYDGKLYLLVPRVGVLAFDPAAGQWDSTVPAPPLKPRSSQIAGHGGRLWLLGGRDIPGQTEVLCYDLKAKAWSAGPDLPRPMAWGAASELGGRLTVSAGAVGRCFANQTYMLRGEP